MFLKAPALGIEGEQLPHFKFLYKKHIVLLVAELRGLRASLSEGREEVLALSP